MREPQEYDKYAHEPFAVTVDLAVFTIREGALHVLLVERGQEPYAGQWALPGGFVLPDESAEGAAQRELAEETGLADVSGLHLEQVRTYSDPGRDPRMRVVSVAFAALVPDLPEARAGGDAAGAAWLPYGPAAYRPLAFDHDRILSDAYDRVGAKLEYTGLATAFCPPEFTLGELRQVYEAVWGAELDPANFRRKVVGTAGLVEAIPGAARLTGGRGKPAALFRAGTATALHPPLLRPTPEGPSS